MKKRRFARTLLVAQALVITQILAITPPVRALAPETCWNRIFAPVAETLRARTRVPLRLPAVVGGDYDAVLYAEAARVTRTSYEVRVGQQCERSFCPYATLSGRRISAAARRPRGKAVELTGGVRAYLLDGSRSSKDSVITWDEGRYRYTITVYSAEPAALIRVANSALSCVNP